MKPGALESDPGKPGRRFTPRGKKVGALVFDLFLGREGQGRHRAGDSRGRRTRWRRERRAIRYALREVSELGPGETSRFASAREQLLGGRERRFRPERGSKDRLLAVRYEPWHHSYSFRRDLEGLLRGGEPRRRKLARLFGMLLDLEAPWPELAAARAFLAAFLDDRPSFEALLLRWLGDASERA